MRIGYARANTLVLVGHHPLDEVNQFMNLGSVITPDSGTDKDIACRLRKAACAMRNLNPVWRSTTISLSSKVRLFNTIVVQYDSRTNGYLCEWNMEVDGNNHLTTECFPTARPLTDSQDFVLRSCYQRGGPSAHCPTTASGHGIGWRFCFAGHVLCQHP